jgi:hypothetical protein
VIQASPEVAVVHGTAQRALRSVAIAWT